MGKNPEVLLGVCGSIAAYKALELVRLFQKKNWQVTAVLTRAAAKLVGIDSFRTLTGREVAVSLFPKFKTFNQKVEHVDLAEKSDLIVVAPATANIIGKLTNGIADDLLSTLLLAVPQEKVRAGRVIFAPAMNQHMWLNPIVQANVNKLTGLGYRIVMPSAGELACDQIGIGRMAHPEEIITACEVIINEVSPLNEVPVLITTGRTEEPIDPVRIITNRASGLMGVEITRVLRAIGATVTLIAGAVSVPIPSDAVRVRTAEEMKKAVVKYLPSTKILIMCAAVADYQPVQPAREKIHKPTLTIKLKRTDDILSIASRQKNRPLLVGFSQDDSLTNAKVKLQEKGLDLIIANPTTTAGSNRIRPTLIFSSGKVLPMEEMNKSDFAVVLVKVIAQLFKERTANWESDGS